MDVLEWAINSICTQQCTYMSCDPFMNNDLDESGSSERRMRFTEYRSDYQSNGISAANFSAPPLLRLPMTYRLFSLACGFPTDPRWLDGNQAFKSGIRVCRLQMDLKLHSINQQESSAARFPQGERSFSIRQWLREKGIMIKMTAPACIYLRCYGPTPDPNDPRCHAPSRAPSISSSYIQPHSYPKKGKCRQA